MVLNMIDWTEIIGLAASALVTIAYIPEVIKTVTARHTRDLSLTWLIILDASQVLFFVYGRAISSLPLIISSSGGIIMMTIMLAYKLKYKNK
jgi:MtN3 and saliva related transmembrane protein